MQRCFGVKSAKDREESGSCLWGTPDIMHLPVAMVYFSGHLSTKCSFNKFMLFSKCLEYICSSSGKSGLSKNKWHPHHLWTSHFKYCFLLPNRIFMRTLNWIYLSLNLGHFSKLKIKASFMTCSLSLNYESGSSRSTRPAVLPSLPTGYQPEPLHSGCSFAARLLLPTNTIPPHRHENLERKKKMNDYRLIRQSLSASAVTNCSVLTLP